MFTFLVGEDRVAGHLYAGIVVRLILGATRGGLKSSQAADF